MRQNCATVEEAICSFSRGGAELSDDIRRHIEQCASCAEALAEAQTGVAALGCLKPYPQAPDCRSRVASRIGSLSPVPVWRRLTWAAVPAVIAMLVAGLLLLNYTPDNRQAGTTPPSRVVAKQPSQPRVTPPPPAPIPMHPSRVDTAKGMGRKRVQPPVHTQPKPEPAPTMLALATGKSPETTGTDYSDLGFRSGEGGSNPGHTDGESWQDGDVGGLPGSHGKAPDGGGETPPGATETYGGTQWGYGKGDLDSFGLEKGGALTYGGGLSDGVTLEGGQDAPRGVATYVVAVPQPPSGAPTANLTIEPGSAYYTPPEVFWPGDLKDLQFDSHRVLASYPEISGYPQRMYYSGDTSAFNDFLERYSKLSFRNLVLVLHPGIGTVDRGAWTPADYEWTLTYYPEPAERAADVREWDRPVPVSPVSVDVWLGGKVELDKLIVPLNVDVASGGEIERFIADHMRRQEDARAGYPHTSQGEMRK